MHPWNCIFISPSDAKGRFRNEEYFKTMIDLGCGKLNLNIQTP